MQEVRLRRWRIVDRPCLGPSRTFRHRLRSRTDREQPILYGHRIAPDVLQTTITYTRNFTHVFLTKNQPVWYWIVQAFIFTFHTFDVYVDTTSIQTEWQKCSPWIAVSSEIRFMRIFGWVRWRGGFKWEWGYRKWRFSFILPAIFRTFTSKANALVCQLCWTFLFKAMTEDISKQSGEKYNNKAVLSQRSPRNAPHIFVYENFRDALTICPRLFSPKFFMGVAKLPCKMFMSKN